MRTTVVQAVLLLAVVQYVAGDFYMNHPRGSNNKLNEVSNNRDNANRLFDSQNNANAGYQVGDKCDGFCQTPNDGSGTFDPDVDGAGEGKMKYYTESWLYIEWTAQHGCGVDSPDSECEIIFQYMCEKGVRNGKVTGNNNDGGIPFTEDAKDDEQYGRHESYNYYADCRRRERNKGLFTADQDMNDRNLAIHTRQDRGNPDLDNTNSKYGYECPEERDYYPYWHPTPWIDIVVMTSDPERCPYYKYESQNYARKGYCSNPSKNNPNSCGNAGGQWKEEKSWREKNWKIDRFPECIAAEFSRDNHHGNGIGGQPLSYMWKLPRDPHDTCVLRGRYNISTTDYDGWDSGVDAALNGDSSPVKNNPNKDFVLMGECVDNDNDKVKPFYDQESCSGSEGKVSRGNSWKPRERFWRLNIDSSQFARTFEDRSHVFAIVERPKGVSRFTPIYNFNVRGRRGNNQQVYPAVEYDFVPPNLQLNQNDYIHFQWTGSDANPQGNAGNGRRGTDRSNLVLMTDRKANSPAPYAENKLFTKGYGRGPDIDVIEKLAYLGQGKDKDRPCCYKCTAQQKNGDDLEGLEEYDLPDNCCDLNDVLADDEQDPNNCNIMNQASAYFDGGLVKVYNPGTYHVMSTRNNNYSNRGQKNTIIVHVDDSIIFGLIGAAAGLTVVGAITYAALHSYAKSNPTSRIALLRCFPFPWCCCCYFNTREYQTEKHEKGLTESEQYWSSEGRKWKFVLAYVLLNIAFAAYGFCTNYFQPGYPLFIPRKDITIYYGLAKLGGNTLNLNCSIILLPVLRNFISWLRLTPLARNVPLDLHIEFHKMVAAFIVLGTGFHAIFHFFNFAAGAQPWYVPAFTTWAGATGFIIFFCYSAIFVTAVPERVRRNRCCCCPHRGFDCFFRTHHMYIPAMALLMTHGKKFHIWAWFPVCMLILEKIIRHYRSNGTTRLVSAVVREGNVLRLRMKIRSFEYSAGQYLYLNIPNDPRGLISKTEWHPFTITSAPEDPYVELHIRCGGHWTTPVRDLLTSVYEDYKNYGDEPVEYEYYSESEEAYSEQQSDEYSGSGSGSESSSAPKKKKADKKKPGKISKPNADAETGGSNARLGHLYKSWDLIRTDGPYGSASQYVDEYKTVVLVGAGIGVTPFASIMKSLKIRLARNNCDECHDRDGRRATLRPMHVYFYWVCRNMTEFNWFFSLISGIADDETIKNIFTFKTFLTGEADVKALNKENAADFEDIEDDEPEELSYSEQQEIEESSSTNPASIAARLATDGAYASEETEQEEYRSKGVLKITNTGKPNFKRIFAELKDKHAGEEIGVFLCGPPAIAKQLAQAAFVNNTWQEGDTHFTFHKENF